MARMITKIRTVTRGQETCEFGSKGLELRGCQICLCGCLDNTSLVMIAQPDVLEPPVNIESKISPVESEVAGSYQEALMWPLGICRDVL